MTGPEPRRRAIAEIISSGSVPSQDALRAELAGLGHEVTQSTLSRDLRALGVVEGPGGYAMPGSVNGSGSGASEEPLRRALRSALRSARAAGQLVVLRTGPGHAQPVALALDTATPPGVVGTVAGDDTIFVATASNADARAVTRSLLELAGAPAGREAS